MTNVAKCLFMPMLEWLLQNHCDRIHMCVCLCGDKDSASQDVIKLERGFSAPLNRVHTHTHTRTNAQSHPEAKTLTIEKMHILFSSFQDQFV